MNCKQRFLFFFSSLMATVFPVIYTALYKNPARRHHCSAWFGITFFWPFKGIHSYIIRPLVFHLIYSTGTTSHCSNSSWRDIYQKLKKWWRRKCRLQKPSDYIQYFSVLLGLVGSFTLKKITHTHTTIQPLLFPFSFPQKPTKNILITVCGCFHGMASFKSISSEFSWMSLGKKPKLWLVELGLLFEENYNEKRKGKDVALSISASFSLRVVVYDS